MPRLVKHNGNREPFDKEKLKTGNNKALEKRPVNADDVEAVINQIMKDLQALGEREVQSLVIGELIMAQLRKLDQVAYVRFASVYRDFKDLRAFREEIDKLEGPSEG